MDMVNDTPLPRFSGLYAEEISQQKKALDEFAVECANIGTMVDSAKPMSNGWSLIDCGSFDEFQEGGYSTYVQIAKACKNQGIAHVYDIGCNTAWQGKIFKAMGIGYTGIEVDPHSIQLAPKEDGIGVINRAYPYPIEPKDRAHTAAISNLCVGFGLLEGNPEGRKDFTESLYKQMAKDFDYFVGSPGPESQHVLKEKFGVLDISVGSDKELIPVWGNRDRFRDFNLEAERKWDKRTERLFGIRMESLVKEVKKEEKTGVKIKHDAKRKISLKPKAKAVQSNKEKGGRGDE